MDENIQNLLESLNIANHYNGERGSIAGVRHAYKQARTAGCDVNAINHLLIFHLRSDVMSKLIEGQ